MLRITMLRQTQAVRALLQRRCFAESAVSTQLKEPDWEAFGAIVTSDEGKRELATLRSQFAEIKTRLTSQSQAPQEVKWEEYKDVEPVVLDGFKSAMSKLKIPKFDVTEHVKKVDTDFDPLLKSATELEAFSQKRQKEIEDEIKQIDVEIEKLNTKTVDEELSSDPKLLKEVDEEISKGSYY
ncbi:g12858 [Coccomyxa viridis]|uniref:G12858 protein n=1 Tax=Coccomyxa viridis TaxID=1274662 RepID=A0ABP1GFQ5_9CHLO